MDEKCISMNIDRIVLIFRRMMRDVFEWLIIDYCKESVFMRMMRDEYLRLSSSSPQTPPW